MRPRNDTLLRALRREPTEYTPVWLMRQAGRYLPEYNRTRERAGSFMALAGSPELATEVTLQPLERFPLDAAILFSDILTVPDAMGLGLSFAEGEGPRFARPVRTEADVAALAVPDMARLRYVFDAVASIRRALDGRVPLIGFAGSPFTLACYMVEGRGSDNFATTKRLAYTRPDLFHRLLEINAQAVAEYLSEQVRHGAQAVMLFDTWGGMLTPAAYRDLSLAYARQVLTVLPREHDGQPVPRILFTKGGGTWLAEAAGAGADALGVDWTTDLGWAREQTGGRVALQGNLDPAILLTDPRTVADEARRVLDSFGKGPGHVFNLGHGIWPSTPPENVAALVEAVHGASRRPVAEARVAAT